MVGRQMAPKDGPVASLVELQQPGAPSLPWITNLVLGDATRQALEDDCIRWSARITVGTPGAASIPSTRVRAMSRLVPISVSRPASWVSVILVVSWARIVAGHFIVHGFVGMILSVLAVPAMVAWTLRVLLVLHILLPARRSRLSPSHREVSENAPNRAQYYMVKIVGGAMAVKL